MTTVARAMIRAARLFSSRPSRSSWVATFARELREELTPAPDPPGYTRLDPFDPARWEKLTPAQVRASLQIAAWMSWVDWRTAAELLVGRKPFYAPHEDDSAAAGTSAGASSEAAHGVSPEPPLFTAEDARATVVTVISRVRNLSNDEAARAQLAGFATSALRLARDVLDEFLIGYAEGKNVEVKAFIAEELEREVEFVERIKGIRAKVSAEVAERESEGEVRGSGVRGSGVR